MKYYLIAGEASGDLHASHLMEALKKLDSNAQFRFYGGDLMLKQGGTLVKHYKEMAFMGFLPVLMNLKTILANLRSCQKDIKSDKPDIIILVDYPGFNLKIAKFAKQLNIPIYYYISPKIWAWKEYRIKEIKSYVNKMLCILPFEVDFYAKHNYAVDYVGNPTKEEILKCPYKDETFKEFTTGNGLSDKNIIALLAGSRKQEIKGNLPEMIKAASNYKDYQLVIAGAPGISLDFYEKVLNENDVKIVFNMTYRLLQQADVALVTSGTATLETALLKTPQVVCYKSGGKLVYHIFKRILKVPYVSLVNLIAGKVVVKELLAHLFSVENIRQEIDRILFNAEYKKEILKGYELVDKKLGNKLASENAAEIIYFSMVKKKK